MRDIDSLQWGYRDRLPMWVIYRPTTTDHPGFWVARMHFSLPQPEPTKHFMLAKSLDEARAMLPFGLHKMKRHVSDDPNIEEVWL